MIANTSRDIASGSTQQRTVSGHTRPTADRDSHARIAVCRNRTVVTYAHSYEGRSINRKEFIIVKKRTRQ